MVKWIKLSTEIFDNRKIRQIEAMPEGDALVVIWLKLLILAGETNDGGFVYFTRDIPYTEELLATQFNRPITTVRLALQVFEQFGMIDIIDSLICVTNWEKYQNTEKLGKIREQTRQRVARHRERKRLENVTQNVTQCNALDKDIDKEKEVINNVVFYLNKKAGTRFKKETEKTRKLIKARLNEGFTEEDIRKVIDKKTEEWLGTEMAQYLRPETLFGTKFEGYLNQPETKRKKNRFNDFDQRSYDWQTLEDKLVNQGMEEK